MLIGGNRLTTQTGWVAHISDGDAQNYDGSPKLMCRVKRHDMFEAPHEFPVCKACERVMETRAFYARGREFDERWGW